MTTVTTKVQRFLSDSDNSSVLIEDIFPNQFMEFNLTWYSKSARPDNNPQTISLHCVDTTEMRKKLWSLYNAIGEYLQP